MQQLFVFALLLPTFTIAQNRYDVVIDEIMADPAPPTGLPNNEWLELKNTSGTVINLQNWRIGDASGQSGPLPNFLLRPDSCVIICTGTAVAALSAFGSTLAVTSFPSLDNDGDQLFLKAANGKIIHAISYSTDWYRNELKKDGGWTLEMIDPKNPCSGSSNWKASTHIDGGTPGKKNSVDAINSDTTSPKLKRAYTTDSITIILVYDEPVDSLTGATLSNYTIDGGVTITGVVTLAPLFSQVQLKLSSPLIHGSLYTIIADHISDCMGNQIGASNKTRIGLPEDAMPGDWVINEVMFDPRPNAFDFVEFHSNSNKILDASKLYIANRNATNLISSIKQLSNTPFYIFPGEHIVITEDADNLARQYLVRNPENVLPVAGMPSFPDDEGTVVTLNFQGDIVDELHYKDDWHFKLIDHDEGISLERISSSVPSQLETNWHSAAFTAGYGTPTYKNSQNKLLSSINATIAIVPLIFSPDNDGQDDVATIQYQVTEPGYIANIVIYDAAGRPVRRLIQNGTLGLTGSWNWDGVDDKGNKLPVGIYIIFTELFNLQGKKLTTKNPVILARKLN